MSVDQSAIERTARITGQAHQPVHRRILAVALPAILANLTSVLPAIVDTAWVGTTGTRLDLGGIALGSTITGFILWAFSFLRIGTAGFAAQAFGARDESEQRSTLLRALGLAIIFGFALMLLMVPLGMLGFAIFDTGSDALDIAGRYYHIRMFAAPFDLVLYVVIGWLLGRRRVRDMVALQVFLNVLNIALCYLFVVLMGRGVDGAAAATAISIGITCGVGLIIVRTQFRVLSPRGAESRLIESEKLLGLMAVNRDIFLRTFVLMTFLAYLVRVGAGMGDTILAANHILFGFVAIIAQGLDGFAQATETLTGQAIGARDRQRLGRVVWAGSFWGLLFALLVGFGLYKWGVQLLPHFTTDVDVLETARDHFLWIAAAPLVAIWCFQLDGIYFGATRGAEIRNGMMIAAIFGLAASLLLPPFWGNQGIWAALYVFYVMRALPLVFWYRRIPRALAR
ncbi:MATE family efflux transporter [Dongia deserti]|uniref:MATE family efflux transporter n=1 Tax=Dongia deserti TaxID=2268030 RepID=UPI0013C4A0AD|nr:MATE family efflux transporter [Dongia deserti]